jgi:hypothetical protein
MQVKNNRDETVMQVTSEGKTEIADSLTVRALENTSSDESSLVGVNKNGTLVKANLDLMQQGLIFYPVGKHIAEFFIRHSPGNLEDTLQTGIDIQSLTGITIPDKATHILIRAALNVNYQGLELGYPVINAGAVLYVAGQGELNDLQNLEQEHKMCQTDGSMFRTEQSHTINGETITFVDYKWDYEQQSENTKLMELPADKTFSYYINPRANHQPAIDFIATLHVNFWLEGYYVPLSTLLEQQ